LQPFLKDLTSLILEAITSSKKSQRSHLSLSPPSLLLHTTRQSGYHNGLPSLQSNPSSLSESATSLQHMGVLARRKSPQTSTAFSAASARGCIDMGSVVGEADVRAKRDVRRRVRRWVVCIFAVRCSRMGFLLGNGRFVVVRRTQSIRMRGKDCG
jgi:hypothetical protein